MINAIANIILLITLGQEVASSELSYNAFIDRSLSENKPLVTPQNP
jgi:hypothetical protein